MDFNPKLIEKVRKLDFDTLLGFVKSTTEATFPDFTIQVERDGPTGFFVTAYQGDLSDHAFKIEFFFTRAWFNAIYTDPGWIYWYSCPNVTCPLLEAEKPRKGKPRNGLIDILAQNIYDYILVTEV